MKILKIPAVLSNEDMVFDSKAIWESIYSEELKVHPGQSPIFLSKIFAEDFPLRDPVDEWSRVLSGGLLASCCEGI